MAVFYFTSMGTIRKQSIYSSLFIYAGFAIGAINVLVLFPRYFTAEQFGLTRIIMDIAMIFTALCLAGTQPVGYKFYPYYKHHLPKERNDLPAILLTVSLSTCFLLYVLLPVFQPWLLRKFGQRSPLLLDHFDLVFPLTVSLVLFALLESASWFINRSVASNFLKEFAFRSLTMLLIGIWIAGYFSSFRNFIISYTYLNYIPLAVLLLVIYQGREYALHWKISTLTRRLSLSMLKFGSAYFLSALLNILAKTNDTLIIASQSVGGLADAAIFTIATYLITVMDVPQRSMIASATPQIAQAWKDHDMGKLDRLYKKTALNLLIIAAGILGLVMINSRLIVSFLGELYAQLPLLMLVLGVGKLIDLGTGMNSQILQLSKHWRIDLFTNMLFVAISIVLNYFLTKSYGIMGTAWGSLSAILLFNLIRFIYIKKIYGLQPFSKRNAIALASAVALTSAFFFLDVSSVLWINSLIHSLLFLGLYGFVIIKFRISEDISELYTMGLSRLSRSRNGG